MAGSPANPERLPWKKRMVASLTAAFTAAIGRTLRIRFTDTAGLVADPPSGPVIWCLWHNRIAIMPWWHRTIWKTRPACVLTSPSGDGAVIASVCAKFRIGSVRGSSNKQGARALVELRSRLKNGVDITFTPDGPRGPRYVIAPGILKIAELTGTPIVPLHIVYENAWRLKSWDGFYIPKPFSRVRITYDELFYAKNDSDEERERLQEIMRRQLAGDEAGIGTVKKSRPPKSAAAGSEVGESSAEETAK